ncbi:MAG: flavodoxin family protein [Chloroflexota bacterium]
MKILALSCSPRRQGNTEILLDEVLNGARHDGAEVELYSVAGKKMEPCDACRACGETGICHIKDDMQELYDKLLAADGIVIGVPVYFYTMAAQAKIIIDRSIALSRPNRRLANKVCGLVVTAGSLGVIDVLKDLYFFIVARQMLPAHYVAAYAMGKGDVKKRELGMKAAFELGQQMVQIAAKKFEYPNIPRRSIAYGTHTH